MKELTHPPQAVVHRATLVLTSLIILLGLLIARLYFLQCSQHLYYRQQALAQHWTKKERLPQRGEIRDRQGELLAISIPGFSCYAEPQNIEARTASALAEILGQSVETLQARLSGNRRFVWLQRRLSASQVKSIQSLKLEGIGFREEPVRAYPMGTLAAHLLGFVGVDHHGLDGLEAALDEELVGSPGYTWVLKDGRLARFSIHSPEAPALAATDGATVYLTIDVRYQYIVEEELQRALEEAQALAGVGILREVTTGELRAPACRPTYDPNRFAEYPQEYWLNRALAYAYEMGSTIKPLIVAGALAQNICTLEETIFCENGRFALPGRVLHDHHGYGHLSVAEVLVKSSNIGMAKIGQRMGSAVVYDTLRFFGLGQKSGIALPGEAPGLVRPLGQWTSSTLASVPMGHELMATPLQMATAYTVLGAGGLYRPPTILSKVVAERGNLVSQETRDAVRVLPEATCREILGVLRKVVVAGTAKSANLPGVSIAGKTGTAQKIGPDGRYSHSQYIASFVGLAPSEEPLLCALVMLDEPRVGHYGGTVAAPPVARILKRVLLNSYH